MDKVLNGADCVFHFAAIAPLPDNQRNPQKSVQNNIESTANVLELSRKAGVKHFILASTAAVYENNYNDFLTEDLQVCPDLIYAVSKVCAEEITKSYNKCFSLPTTILRFFNVYGPHQDFQRLHPPLMAYIARELFLGRQPQLHSNFCDVVFYLFVYFLFNLTYSHSSQTIDVPYLSQCQGTFSCSR